jgi:hypothetical protein
VKSIILNLEDEVHADLEAAIRTKRIEGKFSGLPDMLCLAILESIKTNQRERTVRYRRRERQINAVGR